MTGVRLQLRATCSAKSWIVKRVWVLVRRASRARPLPALEVGKAKLEAGQPALHLQHVHPRQQLAHRGELLAIHAHRGTGNERGGLGGHCRLQSARTRSASCASRSRNARTASSVRDCCPAARPCPPAAPDPLSGARWIVPTTSRMCTPMFPYQSSSKDTLPRARVRPFTPAAKPAPADTWARPARSKVA